jgi:hypothetical protein
MDANRLVLEAKRSAVHAGHSAAAVARRIMAGTVVRAVRASELLHSGASIARAWFLRLPRAARWGAVGGVAVGVLALFLVFRGDPVERAVLRGDLHTARKELRHVHGPSRAYDAGRIQEAQKSYGAAAASYASAARNGDSRGFNRLAEMTRNTSCRARSAAAAALGEIADDRSISALKVLSKGKFRDERGRRGPFACSSRRAARDALDHVRDRG